MRRILKPAAFLTMCVLFISVTMVAPCNQMTVKAAVEILLNQEVEKFASQIENGTKRTTTCIERNQTKYDVELMTTTIKTFENGKWFVQASVSGNLTNGQHRASLTRTIEKFELRKLVIWKLASTRRYDAVEPQTSPEPLEKWQFDNFTYVAEPGNSTHPVFYNQPDNYDTYFPGQINRNYNLNQYFERDKKHEKVHYHFCPSYVRQIREHAEYLAWQLWLYVCMMGVIAAFATYWNPLVGLSVGLYGIITGALLAAIQLHFVDMANALETYRGDAFEWHWGYHETKWLFRSFTGGALVCYLLTWKETYGEWLWTGLVFANYFAYVKVMGGAGPSRVL